MAQEISSSRTITSEYLLPPTDDEACHRKRRRIYHLPTNENDTILDFQSSLQSSILTDEYVSKVINDVKVASDKLRKYYETKNSNNNDTSITANHDSSSSESIAYRPEIDFIPPLVNRIVLEISSTRGKIFKTVELTKELTELIMDFINPFFSDSKVSKTMKFKKQQQLTTIHQTCKKEEEEQEDDTNETKVKLENTKKNTKMLGVYELRAIDWAVARLGDLLRPNIETEIPELEALLAADGPRPHDLSFEKCLQKNLLESMNLMDKQYHHHNNKQQQPLSTSIGWSHWMNHIDRKRYTLMEQIQNMTSNDYDETMDSPNNVFLTSEWAWSRNPYRWFLHLKNTTMLNHNFQSSPTRNPTTTTFSERDVSTELPFLHQMKEFLVRHETDDNLEDLLLLDKKANTNHSNYNQ